MAIHLLIKHFSLWGAYPLKPKDIAILNIGIKKVVSKLIYTLIRNVSMSLEIRKHLNPINPLGLTLCSFCF